MTTISDTLHDVAEQHDDLRAEVSESLSEACGTDVVVDEIELSDRFDRVKVSFELPEHRTAIDDTLATADATVGAGGTVEIPLDALEGDG